MPTPTKRFCAPVAMVLSLSMAVVLVTQRDARSCSPPPSHFHTVTADAQTPACITWFATSQWSDRPLTAVHVGNRCTERVDVEPDCASVPEPGPDCTPVTIAAGKTEIFVVADGTVFTWFIDTLSGTAQNKYVENPTANSPCPAGCVAGGPSRHSSAAGEWHPLGTFAAMAAWLLWRRRRPSDLTKLS